MTRKPAARSAASRREQVPITPRIQTRGVRADQYLASIKYRAAHRTETDRAAINAFADRLKVDSPAHAFEWSRSAFEAAANFEAARQLLALIGVGESLDDDYAAHSSEAILRNTRRWFYDEVLRGALYPERSTSPQSNEMSLTLNSAKAEWLRALDHAIAAIEEDRHP